MSQPNPALFPGQPPALIPPNSSPAIPGLKIPHQFYWVLREPAPLAGMQRPWPPAAIPWSTLHQEGFRWVVCLNSERPPYDPAPLKWLIITKLTDLDERELPDEPEREEQEIRDIAARTLAKLDGEEGVIVHCAGGRGRTGTVLGAILKRLGLCDQAILQFLNDVHRIRGKEGWPEADWQEKVVRTTTARKTASGSSPGRPETP